jgi:putative ABC transport system permease protein
MFRNYFVVAFRIFYRQKVYTFLNIAGLSIGLSAVLLIFGYILDELTYDKIHPYARNTYRIGMIYIPENGNEQRYSVAPPIWSRQLKEQYPYVHSILCTNWYGYPFSVNYKDKDKIVLTEELYFIDGDYSEVMYFNVISGDKQTAFKDINSIALNTSAAKRIFGSGNPIGKILTIKHISATSNKELNLVVTAVFKDYPSNTNFKPSYLVPMESLKYVADWGNNYDRMFTGWLNGWMDSYVVFKDGTDIEDIENGLKKMVSENLGEDSDNIIPFLKNISDLHFDNEVKWYNEGSGDIKHVYILGSIAIFLILIASINYMNLATARSVKRSREVGMRKVIGGYKYQLIYQFLFESFITTFFSLILCLFLVLLVLPVFNTLSQKGFVFNTFFNIRLLGGIAAILIVVTILAGSYPAFYLSNFKPVQMLKGGNLNIKGSDAIRKILVISQFLISLLMLICSGVLMKQVNFMKYSKLNEHGEQIISIRYGGGTAPIEKYSVYRHSVLEDPNLNEMTMGNHLPRQDFFGWIGATVKIPGLSNQEYQWESLNVEFNFPEVFNLELLTGRDFILGNPADSDACLINEAAVKNLGIDITESVGLRIEDTQSKRISTVIGVVKDFPYESVLHNIKPLRISSRLHPTDQIVYVKLPAKDIQNHIQTLESKWKKIFPGIGFDYWFVNDEFNRLYESEIRMSELSEIFSVIAIFIACLGLFGLALYITEQRAREISIRKVMGASEKQILVLFLNVFIKMLIISTIIAIPLAYFIMNKWLQQFVYRISIDWKIILSAFGIVFGLTMLTVCYEVIKASTADPANAIRYE